MTMGMRADFHTRYEHRIAMTLFADAAAYNAHQPRHPLPDLLSNTPWETRYRGFEAATALPPGLTEAHAKAFVISVTRFQDYIRKRDDDADSGYNTLRRLPSDAQTLHFKTTGYINLIEDKICIYIARVLKDAGFDGAALSGQLGRMGVAVEGVPCRGRKPGFITYKPAGPYMAEHVAQRIAVLPGGSYLGYMMAHFNNSKPQYTQAVMFFIGDALDLMQARAPDHYDVLHDMKNAYRETGLADAVNALRTLLARPAGITPARP